MTEGASKYLFLCLLLVLTFYSSGTLVGFSYDARKHKEIPSPTETIHSLKLNNIIPSQIRISVANHQALNSLYKTSVSVDLYLKETLVENLRNHNLSAISWLKTHLTASLPHVNIKSIAVSGSRDDLPGEHDLHLLLSTLKSLHSILNGFHLQGRLKASASFSLSFWENLNITQKRDDLQKVLNFIKKVKSFVIVEATVDGELSKEDEFVKSLIRRASSAAEIIPSSDVSMVLKIKSSVVPKSIEVPELIYKVLRSLQNNSRLTGKTTELFVEMSRPKEFEREEEKMFESSHRELLDDFHNKTALHDTIYPPMTFPVTPVISGPQDNLPTPTIVTVPSSTPVTIPSTTPVSVPSTNPANSPVPITNPVTTPAITVPGTTQPITNPVTTYPAPSTGVPTTTPVTNPVGPPATNTGGGTAAAGQNWCVAKSGAAEAALQAALDYACGIGGVDCSVIQGGAGCFNPNTLENHASYAFNSYYQKNPIPTSCDFGGTAVVTTVNPSKDMHWFVHLPIVIDFVFIADNTNNSVTGDSNDSITDNSNASSGDNSTRV
ncbi:hypothetical protein U1Q18_004355 [Sarracenia purpurea var. burkii]